MDSRISFAAKPNGKLTSADPNDCGNNEDFIEATRLKSGVLLLGGTSVLDFHIRVAQRRMRNDLLPSYWSEAALLLDGRVHGVSLNEIHRVNEVPRTNGVAVRTIKKISDPERYPNIALIAFTHDHAEIKKSISAITSLRSAVDVPGMITRWLGFLWGVAGFTNPLDNGTGIPSAAFVEAACADAGLDLTPGLSTEASCPEVIWQAAKWWQGYYQEAGEHTLPGSSTPCVPVGMFLLRQDNPRVLE